MQPFHPLSPVVTREWGLSQSDPCTCLPNTCKSLTLDACHRISCVFTAISSVTHHANMALAMIGRVSKASSVMREWHVVGSACRWPPQPSPPQCRSVSCGLPCCVPRKTTTKKISMHKIICLHTARLAHPWSRSPICGCAHTSCRCPPRPCRPTSGPHAMTSFYHSSSLSSRTSPISRLAIRL